MLETSVLNSFAIFNAKMVEGTYLLFSIATIDWRDTPICSANCDWVMSNSARNILILFFMACLLPAFPQLVVELCTEQHKHQKHVGN